MACQCYAKRAFTHNQSRTQKIELCFPWSAMLLPSREMYILPGEIMFGWFFILEIVCGKAHFTNGVTAFVRKNVFYNLFRVWFILSCNAHFLYFSSPFKVKNTFCVKKSSLKSRRNICAESYKTKITWWKYWKGIEIEPLIFAKDLHFMGTPCFSMKECESLN